MLGKVLVLGLGNALLTDDGVGVHVIAALEGNVTSGGVASVVVLDGGTLGLSLLPEIESAAALIVVDAANFGGAPGDVRVFDAEAMDVQLGAAKTSAHELALADLIGAARLQGSLPERRALVGIAPLSVEWGLEPTPKVAASIPVACAEIETLIEGFAA
jgi:hydrogenase maturation protease